MLAWPILGGAAGLRYKVHGPGAGEAIVSIRWEWTDAVIIR